MVLAPEQLRGEHVLEAGVRQSWPFLTFSRDEGEAESRLYIDTAFAVEPAGQRYCDGDAFRAGAALIDFNTYTVVAVAETLDGGLALTFNDQRVIRIDGTAQAYTVGQPWSLHVL